MKKLLYLLLCLVALPVLVLEGAALVVHAGLKMMTDTLVRAIDELHAG